MKNEDTLSPYANFSFIKSRIPALDALSMFVPEGKEEDPVIQETIRARGFSRWYPEEGGHKVVIPHDGQKFDDKLFTLEKRAWNHEHCKGCGGNIEPMELCWVTESGPYVVLCISCHKKLDAV